VLKIVKDLLELRPDAEVNLRHHFCLEAARMHLEGTRQSEANTLGRNLLKTVGQIALVWGVFLWLIPLILVRVEMVASISPFAGGWWSELGLLLFMASSTIFLLCVWNMVWLGQGTPWPWDRSTNFVVAGPYRWVRNPMVISAIGQGLASALILGSYLGFAYLILGITIWNSVLRPLEEADLAHRFGKPYVDYFQSVSAWIPKFTPHRSMIIEATHEDVQSEDS
jgi:protein-S-isoprenylcysteine O-methyltransferase Ste14